MFKFNKVLTPELSPKSTTKPFIWMCTCVCVCHKQSLLPHTSKHQKKKTPTCFYYFCFTILTFHLTTGNQKNKKQNKKINVKPPMENCCWHDFALSHWLHSAIRMSYKIAIPKIQNNKKNNYKIHTNKLEHEQSASK